RVLERCIGWSGVPHDQRGQGVGRHKRDAPTRSDLLPPALGRATRWQAWQPGMTRCTAMTLRAVLFDFGHTLVDFHRTQDALLDAYEQVRARIEAALNIDAPEVGHLIDRVANEVDRLVAVSYAEG